MARIAYSCCGEGRGHSSRTLTMVRRLRSLGHEVIVFASNAAYSALRPILDDVVEIPGFILVYEHNRIRLRRTARENARIWKQKNTVVSGIDERLKSFQPNLAITDFEPFLPIAARKLGIPFISLDHQHVIPGLSLRPPVQYWFQYALTLFIVHATHRGESANLVSSFFRPSARTDPAYHYFGPILRDELLQLKPHDNGHVLVYQTSSSFTRLPEILQATPHRYRIYAFPREGQSGNCAFKPRNHPDFISDLTSASWVLTNGGYTLMSESLFLGKPVLSIPVAGQFEQWINAHFLTQLGFGHTCTQQQLNPALIHNFAANLPSYRTQIQQNNFHGNDAVLQKILYFL